MDFSDENLQLESLIWLLKEVESHWCANVCV